MERRFHAAVMAMGIDDTYSSSVLGAKRVTDEYQSRAKLEGHNHLLLIGHVSSPISYHPRGEISRFSVGRVIEQLIYCVRGYGALDQRSSLASLSICPNQYYYSRYSWSGGYFG